MSVIDCIYEIFDSISTIEDLERLLKNGVDPNAKDNRGSTPLHIAVSNYCDIKIIRVLLEYGANPNEKNTRGSTPLHVTDCNIELIRLLLEFGANINEQNEDGDTILHYASACGSIKMETVKLLLEHGADYTITNDQNESCLEDIPASKRDILIQKHYRPPLEIKDPGFE